MKVHAISGAAWTADDVQDVLRRVREVDPTCHEAAIHGYVREVTQADAALDAVDLGETALPVSFSASWPDRTDHGAKR